MPFTTYHLQLFAPIKLGALEGLAFVDTGATQSTLLKSYSEPFEKLELEESWGAYGVRHLEQCIIPAVRFLNTDYADVQVHVEESLNVTLPEDPSPVLMRAGADLLTKQSLIIDFSKEHLGFGAGDYFEQSPVQKVSLKTKLNLFDIEIGSLTLPCIFDTGAGLSVLNARFLDAVKSQMEELEPIETRDGSGKVFPLRVFYHPAVSLAGKTLGDVRLLVIDLSPIEQFTGKEIGAVLGFEAMKNHSWLLEWSEELLWRF